MGFCHAGENFEGDAGFVRQTDDHHAGHIGVLRHTLNQHLFHFRSLLDFGAGHPFQAGEHFQLHVVFFRHFHRPGVEHLGAQCGQLQHFVVGDFLQLDGAGDLAGVGGVDAFHIGKNLAQIGLHGGGDGHGAGIGSAPAQGGDVVKAVQPLEARHHDDPLFVQRRADPLGVHPLDAGGGVGGVGLEPGLPAEQGDHREAQLFDGHAQHRDGNLLPGGQQHIHFPLAAAGIDFLGFFNEIVGGVALSGHHHHHVVARLIGIGDDLRDVEDPLGIGDGAAAELLHYQHT